MTERRGEPPAFKQGSSQVSLHRFLRLVLPPGGYYCSWSSKPGRPKGGNRFYPTLDLLSEYLAQNDAGRNKYFALANFATDENRTEANALSLRTLFLDLDCGVKDGKQRDYATKRDALAALLQFCQQLALPAPTLVDSGWGIHAYWPLTTSVAPQVWRDAQNILGFLAPRFGLTVDRAALNKVSQVTRPINSLNVRTDDIHPTRLLKLTEANSNELLITLIQHGQQHGYAQHPPEAKLTRPQQSKYDTYTAWPPAKADLIEQQCGQVQYALQNPNTVGYDYWRRLLGVAKFCEDPEQTAIKWSQGYVNYSETETIDKLHSWRAGPSLCESLGTSGRAGVCNTCPLQSKIISPVQAGLRYAEAEPGDAEVVRNYRCLPDHGVIKILADGTEQPITPYDLSIKEIIWAPNEKTEYVTLQWHGLQKHTRTKREAVLPWYTVAPGFSGVVESLNRVGITTARGKIEANDIAMYLSEYKLNLERKRARPEVYDSMGWKSEKQHFVLGNTLITADEAQTITLTRDLQTDLAHDIRIEGSFDEWKKAVAHFGHPELRMHAFAFLAGFAAPLFNLTGLNGIIVNQVGPTGTGKSTVGALALSIYGDPARLALQSNATTNAMFNHFAAMQNLPVYCDEITNMPAANVSDFCYITTMGEERRRLQKDGTPRNSRRWNTIALTSSNMSMADKLMSKKLNPDAEMMRLFEVQINPTDVFEKDRVGTFINTTIRRNFGHAGIPFLQYCVANLAKLEQRLEETNAIFSKQFRFDFSSQERFYEKLFGCVLIAGLVAKKLNLVPWPIEPCVRAALRHLRGDRILRKEAATGPTEIVANYAATAFSQIQVVKPMKGDTLDHVLRVAHGSLCGLIEIRNPKDIRFYAALRPFEQWLLDHGLSPREVKAGLIMDDVVLGFQKKQLAAGTGALQCIVVNLAHKKFANQAEDLRELTDASETY